MAPDRVPCIVPFCRRTAPREKMPEAIEMLCGKCGRRAPRELKFWRAVERHRKAEAALGLDLTRKQWRRYDRAWSRLVAAAVAASVNAPARLTPSKRKPKALRKPKARATVRRAATQARPGST